MESMSLAVVVVDEPLRRAATTTARDCRYAVSINLLIWMRRRMWAWVGEISVVEERALCVGLAKIDIVEIGIGEIGICK